MNRQTFAQTVAQIDALVEAAARALFARTASRSATCAPTSATPPETTTWPRASASPARDPRRPPDDHAAGSRGARVARGAPASGAVRTRRVRLGRRAREPARRPGEERARAVRPRARAEHADGGDRLARPPSAGDDRDRAALPLRRGRGSILFYFDAAVAEASRSRGRRTRTCSRRPRATYSSFETPHAAPRPNLDPSQARAPRRRAGRRGPAAGALRRHDARQQAASAAALGSIEDLARLTASMADELHAEQDERAVLSVADGLDGPSRARLDHASSTAARGPTWPRGGWRRSFRRATGPSSLPA